VHFSLSNILISLYRVLKKWRNNAIVHYSGTPSEHGKNVKKNLFRDSLKIWRLQNRYLKLLLFKIVNT
jgi:predicted methyltransferase